MTAPTGRIHTIAGGLYTGFRIFVHFHEFHGGTHRAEVIPTSSSEDLAGVKLEFDDENPKESDD